VHRLISLLIAATLLGGSVAASALDWPHPESGTRSALLPAAQAFEFIGARVEHRRLRLSWRIAPGYYLYRDRIHVRVLTPSSASLGAATLPPAVEVDEPGLGEVAVYHGALTIDYALAASAPTPKTIEVEYQGCAEIGVCYQPQTHRLDLTNQD
jgi:Thiol:disulfide interchange protein